MSYHVLISIVVVIAGITSLYLLLALFQNYLPTQAASEVRKLSKVAQAPFPQLRRESQEVSQSTHILNQGDARRERFSRTSLVKNLRHGAWSMSPMLFHLCSLSVSIGVAAAVASIADPFVIPFALLSGPLSMRLALRRSIEQRTRRFSNDYPQFLMTTVSLLKTGMTPSGALQEAALGLESESLVRKEVLSMIERIRVGMSEEKSIGGFAETIAHPEIELFVQSLLLGLRIGGSLADSLERLSKQVRKRQHFKSSAIASVTQQRGSIIAIGAIMGALAAFIGLAMPDMIIGLCANPTGWIAVQVAVLTVIVAVLWFQSITRIKI